MAIVLAHGIPKQRRAGSHPTFGNAPPLDAPGHSHKKADRHVCVYIICVCHLF